MNSRPFHTAMVSSHFSAPEFAKVLQIMFGGEVTEIEHDHRLWTIGNETYLIQYDAFTGEAISRWIDEPVEQLLASLKEKLIGTWIRFESHPFGPSEKEQRGQVLVEFFKIGSNRHIGTVHLVGSDFCET